MTARSSPVLAAKAAARYVSKAKNEAVRFTFSKNSKDRLDFSGWNNTFDSKAPPPAPISKVG